MTVAEKQLESALTMLDGIENDDLLKLAFVLVKGAKTEDHGRCTEKGQESEQAGEGQAQREELHDAEAG